ncbi:uncharacterized protein A4U43_C07F31780 [Asparagus officinalis]|uniref:Uncharacterized protein n=1 Tax=Asparagus officinalis TaxID=4686 RepID=A0A5P1ELM4_ASPOF|nr:uncharacterized protein A4U43_C07F31780 [Asparagus officinalis]
MTAGGELRSSRAPDGAEWPRLSAGWAQVVDWRCDHAEGNRWREAKGGYQLVQELRQGELEAQELSRIHGVGGQPNRGRAGGMGQEGRPTGGEGPERAVGSRRQARARVVTR